MAYETAVYAGNPCGPGKLGSNIAEIQASGVTTLMLWSLHIGRPSVQGQQYGDFVFNDGANLFISQGQFNPTGSAAIAAWPGQIAALRQKGGVQKVYFSTGGESPPVFDFTSIEYMLNNGMSKVLAANLAALRSAFTVNGTCVIDGIDFDCEEFNVKASTIEAFGELVFQAGFDVSFCPWQDPAFWQGCMNTLWQKGFKVSRWNLQCYDGGNINLGNLPSWIAAIAAVAGKQAAPSYLMPGLAVVGQVDAQCPTGPGGVCRSFSNWSAVGLAGGFLWLYDSMGPNPGACADPPTLANYVDAINNGLANNC